MQKLRTFAPFALHLQLKLFNFKMTTKGRSRHVEFDLECGWSDLQKGQDRQARIAGFYHESVLQNLSQDLSGWEGAYDPQTTSTATPPSEPEGAECLGCVCFVE